MKNPFRLRRQKKSRLTPDGLPITEFPAPVQSLLRLYGLSGSYGAIYATQQNVRTVVDTIAREAAELKLKMYMKDPRGHDLPTGRIEVGDHRMITLLDEPMPGESLYRFWFSTFADIGIYDRAIWFKVRMNGLLPRALVRIPPASLLPERDSRGNVVRWRDSSGIAYSPDDLIVFWGYDPQVGHGSIAPLETLRRILAEEYTAAQDRELRWSRAARKEGVIEQDLEATPMSDEARESFMLDVEDSLAGSSSSHRPLMLEPGMHWKDDQFSPRDMEYLGARKLSRVEVAAAYHFPPAMVAASQNGTEPDEKTLNFFYTSTLPPYLSRVEREIEAQLLPEFELSPASRRQFYVEFNLDAKLRGSFEKQAEIMATTAGGPVVTVNEGRARLNLPPIPGGDLIYVPLNSIRAGGPQASPQSPVETPAEGLEPAGTTPGGGTQPAASFGPIEMKTAADVLAKFDADARRLKQREDHAAFLREQRAKYEEIGTELFIEFFKRQRNALRGGKGMKLDRWDRELADDLFGLLYQLVGTVGEDAAGRFDKEFDHERTANFLKKHAELVAGDINLSTDERLAKAIAGTKADEDQDGIPDDREDIVFSDERARELGTSLTTYAIGWGVLEVGRQLGGKFAKTWLVTSRNPRQTHSQIDGTSAGWDEEFGNGLLYPGDGAMGPEEAANCRCIMTMESGQ